MQLVIHSSFGSRLNRAWGLALRKRFCKKFNFELQAAATEDAIVLSLGETHSFSLDEVTRYLNPKTVRDVLTQAFLAAPMFNVRWRWNATISLAVPRFRGGKKVPPQLQRIQAEDLVAVVFPDQIACVENVPGEREIPEHPLIEQTIRDGLDEAMDIGGLEKLLENLHSGKIRVVTCDLTEPSPLAQEILNAKPYAFLDDVPLEERRTQAVMSRRWLDPEAAADIGKLDDTAIARVREEAWPQAQTPDELHDAMMVLGFVTESEGCQNLWTTHFESLTSQGRAARARYPDSPVLWVATERSGELLSAFAGGELQPHVQVPPEYKHPRLLGEEALTELLRGRLSGLGPIGLEDLVETAPWSISELQQTLTRLEAEGFALRGSYSPGAETEWCERRLLARIHRYTVNRLRREIEPVTCSQFMRFLFAWQHVAPEENLEGPAALARILDQLEGYELPAAAWEADVLPARLADYDSSWLDSLCQTGRYTWVRLTIGGEVAAHATRSGPIRTSPVAILPRRRVGLWSDTTGRQKTERFALSPAAKRLEEHLGERGASFFDELMDGSGLLRTQLEDALGELVVAGLASSDSFAGLRALLVPSNRRRPLGSHRRRRRASSHDIEDAGRWALLSQTAGQSNDSSPPDLETIEQVAWVLLTRYGVVFKRVLERETTLPRWRDLVMVLRRLEARGEIRGGRFIAGLTGQQFALPEAVTELRNIRRKTGDPTLVSISGADPLNLVGILSPGARLPALLANRVLYKDGTPIALQVGKDVRFLQPVEAELEWDTRNALLRKRIPPPLRSYLGNPQ